MKYRCLTYQEFDLLSTDFDEFLYSEGINSYEWKILQDQYSTEALGLLEKYSDITFEKVMKGVQFLEHRTEKQLLLSKCMPQSITTIGIKIPENSILNLTDESSLEQISNNEIGAYKCFKTTLPYQTDREEQIFNLIESGYYIVDQKAFNQVNLFRLSSQN